MRYALADRRKFFFGGLGARPQGGPARPGRAVYRGPRCRIGHGAGSGWRTPSRLQSKSDLPARSMPVRGTRKTGVRRGAFLGSRGLWPWGKRPSAHPWRRIRPLPDRRKAGGSRSIKNVPRRFRAAHGLVMLWGACPGASGGALTPRVESERSASPQEAASERVQRMRAERPSQGGGSRLCLDAPMQLKRSVQRSVRRSP